MIYLHRTTFDEMDYARIAFFARHFFWVEHATTAWLLQKGIGFATLDREYGFGLPVVALDCRYRSPVQLEQTVEIRLALRDLSRRGFTTPFEIVHQDDHRLVAYGAIRRRVMDVRRLRGAEAPDALYEKFAQMRDESAGMAFPQDEEDGAPT